MAPETQETVSETLRKQLDHLDEMLHELLQLRDRLLPLIERGEKFFADPVGSYLRSPNRPRLPGGRSNGRSASQ